MIKFKKNVGRVLPYKRRERILWDRSKVDWYGVSFQLGNDRRDIGLAEFVEKYEGLFKNVVAQLSNGASWIVNHSDTKPIWRTNSSNLGRLRKLFKQIDVPDAFNGALIFPTADLLDFARDIISYPGAPLEKTGFLYQDIDISHGEQPFVIKISGHMCIDFLSTDKGLLKKVVNENCSNLYTIKQYAGTSL